MKQKRLIFAIAAALAGSPMLANAAPVELTAKGTGTGADDTSSKWAKELKKDDAGGGLAGSLISGNSDTPEALNIETTVGFGFPTDAVRFIRFDLGQGAKFVGHPELEIAAAVVDGTGAAATTDAADPVLQRRTGGNNSTFVTFQLEALGEVLPTEPIILHVPGIRVTGDSTVTVTYTLHNNDASADTSNQANATAVLNTKKGDYIKFVPLVGFTATPAAPLTANVSDGFLKFTPAMGSALFGSIGSITYGPPATLPLTNKTNLVADGNKEAALTDVVGTATLTVTGDFTATRDVTGTTVSATYSSAGNKVYLGTADCSTVVLPAVVTDTTATFTLGATERDNVPICFKPNGVSPMSPSDYSVSLVVVPKEGYLGTTGAGDGVGRIVQNGTVLDTPYLTVNTGYISRVIFTNTSTKEAPYTATIVTDSGATATPGAGATGVIPAGANLQINATDLVAFSGKPRGAVRFVVTAPNPSIQAVYQTVNLASGDVQSVLLNRRGGGDGQY